MTDSIIPVGRRSLTVRQVATSVFLGVPMTIGLVAALSVYCVYECVAFLVRPRARLNVTAGAMVPATDQTAESFSASLAKFADVHARTAAVEQTASERAKQEV